MPPRLKVFITSDGLTDYVVAASSKPKALDAWGSRQDLFKTGLARETDDPALVKAATAQPGEVLRRPAGGVAARLKTAPKPKAPPKPAGPSKAALRKVADLEARLEALQAEQVHEREALEARHAKATARLEAQLSAARRALGS